MKLFRTKDSILEKKDQYYCCCKTGDVFYADHEDFPVDNDGNKIVGEFITKFVYTPEEYVKAFPKGKSSADCYCKSSTSFVFQSFPSACCMPGYMINVSCYPRFIHPKNPKWNQKPRIVINDGDDSYMRKYFETEEEALVGLEELKNLAPFRMCELDVFGYEHD